MTRLLRLLCAGTMLAGMATFAVAQYVPGPGTVE